MIGYDLIIIIYWLSMRRPWPAPEQAPIGVKRLYTARVSQDGEGKWVCQNFYVWSAALDSVISTNMVFMAVGVHDTTYRLVEYSLQEFGSGVSTACVY
jgi:hypothetical protein